MEKSIQYIFLLNGTWLLFPDLKASDMGWALSVNAEHLILVVAPPVKLD